MAEELRGGLPGDEVEKSAVESPGALASIIFRMDDKGPDVWKSRQF